MPPDAPAPSRRLLLVDDHADTLRVMARILRSMGFAVETAVDVATAVEKGSAQRFDLLISDLGLPDGSGVDVLKRIGPMAAITVSGFGTPEDRARTREAGFARHLVKPIDVDELQRTIDSVLR
jgi:DNA-binding response OmpR family regulator